MQSMPFPTLWTPAALLILQLPPGPQSQPCLLTSLQSPLLGLPMLDQGGKGRASIEAIVSLPGVCCVVYQPSANMNGMCFLLRPFPS